MQIILTEQITQADFGRLVGITQARVSELARSGVLPAGGTAGSWLHGYCAHLRAQAAGRAGQLDLSQERAALARTQNALAELKLAEERRELVRRLEVERHLAGGLVALRDRLETVGSRTGAILAAESDTASCARIVRDEIREALSAFTKEIME